MCLFRHSPGKSQDCPALLVACLRGKDGPWKQSLLSAWQSRKRSKPSTPTDVHKVLGEAAQMMHDCPEWNRNVGRNVLHHSGWRAFLQQQGIVRKVTVSRRPGVFVIAGHRYSVATPTELSRKHIEHLKKVGSAIVQAKAPKTIDEWSKAVQEMTDKAEVPSLQADSYGWQWLLRARLVSLMRHQNIKRLAWPRNLKINQFAALFPDQKEHLVRIQQGHTLMADLVQQLKFDGPIELLTMYLCLFLSNHLSKCSPEWLREHRAELIRKRSLYQKKHGLAPHPIVLCTQL